MPLHRWEGLLRRALLRWPSSFRPPLGFSAANRVRGTEKKGFATAATGRVSLQNREGSVARGRKIFQMQGTQVCSSRSCRRCSSRTSCVMARKAAESSGFASSRGRGSATVTIFFTVPGRYVITTTRSASSSDSSMPCVTNTMVCWSSVQIRSNSSCIERLVSASSAPKGSSISSIGASRARQRASATRWRIPPDRSLGNRSPNPRRASLSSSASALARASRSPRMRSPHATFSRTVIQGNSAYSWNTIARSGCGSRTRLPKARISPEVGCVNPAMAFSSVDLPQPDGPSRQTNSPLVTARSIRSRATMLPNLMPTPRIWRAGSGISEPAVPAQEAPVDAGHHGIDGQADHADGDHAGEDLVAPEVLARLEDAVSEPAVDGDHLRHDHHDERHADAHPETGEDRRHRAGKEHAPEERPGAGAEVLRRPHVDRVHAPDPRDGVHQHGEEGAQRDEEEGGRVAQPEPEDGERDVGDGRDGAQELDDRVEQLVDAVARAHPDAEGQGEPGPDHETHPYPQQGRHRVARQLPGNQVLPPLPRHLRGRRKDGGAHVPEPAHRLPTEERGGDDRGGSQRLHFTPRALFASLSRSSLTNSDALGGFAIRPTPYFTIRSAGVCTCSGALS